jgi:hypothetical protein
MGFAYVGLVLLSAAALAFEITLTRLFSVTQWYHFAFLAVSVALLGFGASGTVLSLMPRWNRPPVTGRASIGSAAFAASVVGAYLCLDYLPFDSYRIAWERIQLLYLILYYLALTVPFFCAGLVTGSLLSAHAERATQLYASNLIGSALGGLVPVLFLHLVGEGTILVISALGLLAAFVLSLGLPSLSSAPSAAMGMRVWRGALLAGIGLLLMIAAFLPGLFEIRLSPYKGLSQILLFPDTELTWRQWNAYSRVDRVSGPAIRSAPGLSLAYPGRLPNQDGLFVDGDDLSPVVVAANGSDRADLAEFTSYLPVALAYRLRPAAHALVIEPRGGLDLVVATQQGASSVLALENNPLLIEAAGYAYLDNRVQVVQEMGRSYARRGTDSFDLIHLALTDSYRPVTSGVYSLGERYDLTVEAFEDYWASLRPGGLLIVERWLQLPPSETLRAGATILEALHKQGVPDPASHLAVVRDWQLGLILVKKGPLTSEEVEIIREFSRSRGLDLVALPDLAEPETNQFNILEGPVYYRAFQQLLVDPEAFYASQVYDVRPTTDNRPFFFHFFKWAQTRAVLQQLGRVWQPWGGSGYFVLVALLIVAVVTSAVLILLPLAFLPRTGGESQSIRGWTVAYFGLLGLGFLLVEIPLMQRFILFLGQPIYAFTMVAAALLFFSGLGSLAASRLSPRYTLPLLAMAILLYPLALPYLFDALLGASLLVRLLVSMLCLAPLGFLMGTPFSGGLVWLRGRAPGLIPLAWAVNGCGSVLASIAAAMLALSAGFSWVLITAALSYALAWGCLRRAAKSPPLTGAIRKNVG